MHQGKILAAAGLEPGTPGSESTTLPMSYPGSGQLLTIIENIVPLGVKGCITLYKVADTPFHTQGVAMHCEFGYTNIP